MKADEKEILIVLEAGKEPEQLITLLYPSSVHVRFMDAGSERLRLMKGTRRDINSAEGYEHYYFFLTSELKKTYGGDYAEVDGFYHVGDQTYLQARELENGRVFGRYDRFGLYDRNGNNRNPRSICRSLDAGLQPDLYVLYLRVKDCIERWVSQSMPMDMVAVYQALDHAILHTIRRNPQTHTTKVRKMLEDILEWQPPEDAWRMAG
jgi:hypothetical protein